MKIYRLNNNPRLYKQYEEPWGSLPYPKAPTTVARAGCGCCAVTHLAIEIGKQQTLTPTKTQPYMKQFAVAGHGTEWKGIDEGMKHYGLKNVKRFSDMDSFFKELEKGNRVGVFLFGSSIAPDGTQWTSGGHYVAFTAYKHGKYHWFYTKDSGGRMNDKWHAYEKSMRGCIKMLWVGEIPKESIILPLRGYFDIGDQSESVRMIQRFLKEQKLYKGKIGGNYKKLTRNAVMKFQKKYGIKVDGKWGIQCTKKYEELI